MPKLSSKKCAFLMGLIWGSLSQPSVAGPSAKCTPIDAKFANGYSKIEIAHPGHYCLTEDLHARFEMADHPAEKVMILIAASDVVLDLQGHTLGRGRIFKNPGGFGISIDPRYSNVQIMNGTLQDFEVAIFHDAPKYPASDDVLVSDAQTSAIHRFQQSHIELVKLTFKNNKKNFQIRIPNKAPPDNLEYERRRKSQFPPCGGTDDFGRPMDKDQPCDGGK